MSDAIDVAAFRWAQAKRAYDADRYRVILYGDLDYPRIKKESNDLCAAEQALLHQVDLSVEPPS